MFFDGMKRLGIVAQEELQPNEQDNATQLVGLGGWLVWFQIRLILSVYSFIFESAKVLGEVYIPEYVLALAVLMLFLMVFCIVLFYSRYLLFRIVYLCYEALYVIVVMVVIVFGWVQGHILIRNIAPIIGSIVIIVALFLSKRVKNTFYRLGEKPSQKDKIDIKP